MSKVVWRDSFSKQLFTFCLIVGLMCIFIFLPRSGEEILYANLGIALFLGIGVLIYLERKKASRHPYVILYGVWLLLGVPIFILIRSGVALEFFNVLPRIIASIIVVLVIYSAITIKGTQIWNNGIRIGVGRIGKEEKKHDAAFLEWSKIKSIQMIERQAVGAIKIQQYINIKAKDGREFQVAVMNPESFTKILERMKKDNLLIKKKLAISQ